jgi:hypothetical protein
MIASLATRPFEDRAGAGLRGGRRGGRRGADLGAIEASTEAVADGVGAAGATDVEDAVDPFVVDDVRLGLLAVRYRKNHFLTMELSGQIKSGHTKFPLPFCYRKNHFLTMKLSGQTKSGQMTFCYHSTGITGSKSVPLPTKSAAPPEWEKA